MTKELKQRARQLVEWLGGSSRANSIEHTYAAFQQVAAEARLAALDKLGDEVNQCLQIIVTNAGNAMNVDRSNEPEIRAIEKAVKRAATAIRALAASQPAQPELSRSQQKRIAAQAAPATEDASLEGLRELSEKATPGTWEWHPEQGNFALSCKGEIVGEVPCQSGNEHDGAFFVACVNSVRRILAKGGRS